MRRARQWKIGAKLSLPRNSAKLRTDNHVERDSAIGPLRRECDRQTLGVRRSKARRTHTGITSRRHTGSTPMFVSG